MGYDFFDCVLPTRMARRGIAYTWDGILNLRLKKFETDTSPISAKCGCEICKRHSRAFLRHLITADEITAGVLLTKHNLFFYHALIGGLRTAVVDGKLRPFLKAKLEGLKRKL